MREMYTNPGAIQPYDKAEREGSLKRKMATAFCVGNPDGTMARMSQVQLRNHSSDMRPVYFVISIENQLATASATLRTKRRSIDVDRCFV